MAGSVVGVLVSILGNGQVGLAIAAAFLAAALVSLVARRRRRILADRGEPRPPPARRSRRGPAQGSMSSATPRRTVAIRFASLASSCLPRW